MANIELPDFMSYKDKFSNSKFVEKIQRVAKRAGAKLVYVALILFYTLQSDKVSLKDKAMIVGALGYLISPLDVVPDAIPIAGLGTTSLYRSMCFIRFGAKCPRMSRTRLRPSWLPGLTEMKPRRLTNCSATTPQILLYRIISNSHSPKQFPCLWLFSVPTFGGAFPARAIPCPFDRKPTYLASLILSMIFLMGRL